MSSDLEARITDLERTLFRLLERSTVFEQISEAHSREDEELLQQQEEETEALEDAHNAAIERLATRQSLEQQEMIDRQNQEIEQFQHEYQDLSVSVPDKSSLPIDGEPRKKKHHHRK